MDAIIVIMVVVLVLGLAIGGLFIGLAIRKSIRQAKVREAISAYGWQTDPSPTLERVAGLALPPFDMGFGRWLSKAIIGTTSNGTSFQAFQYRHTVPPFNARIAMIALPKAFPELYVSTDRDRHRRIGVRADKVTLGPRWEPVLEAAGDTDFANALLSPPVLDALAEWAVDSPAGRGFDLSVDGANLVAVGAPTTDEPDELKVFVDRLAQVAALIDWEALARFAIEPKSPRLGFRGTDWQWLPQSQGPVAQFAGIGPVGTGQNPTSNDIVTGTHRGIGFTGFQYQWQTTRTYTTHVNNMTQVHTQTITHHQPVLALRLPAPVPTLTIARGKQPYALRVGPVQPTPFPAFDAMFDVWSSHPQFLADVLTEQLASWFLHWKPSLVIMTGSTVITFPAEHTPPTLWASLDFVCAFCDQIPERVWQTVGSPRPGLRPSVSAPAELAEPDGFVEPEGIVGQA
ncbi:hypothetical protein ACQBAU_06255 [Propionibacteriaceae bacterium Y2011]